VRQSNLDCIRGNNLGNTPQCYCQRGNIWVGVPFALSYLSSRNKDIAN
jgi:hypothetical protein